MPVEIALLAAGFNSVNGTINGADLVNFTYDECNKVLFWIGALMWLFGFIGNIHSDEVVLALRKNKECGEKRYYIPPAKGMHKYVASPNYACEIFEWLGLCVASGFRTGPVCFWLWTVANLAPRARTNYKWYVQTFGDKYPKDRKVLIPFIY